VSQTNEQGRGTILGVISRGILSSTTDWKSHGDTSDAFGISKNSQEKGNGNRGNECEGDKSAEGSILRFSFSVSKEGKAQKN